MDEKDENARCSPEQVAEERIKCAVVERAKTLDLCGLGLEKLPESLGELKQLEELLIYDNELTMLPEWIGKFAELKVLRVFNNKLIALPESIGQLSKLK